jgi:hypothetical protein
MSGPSRKDSSLSYRARETSAQTLEVLHIIEHTGSVTRRSLRRLLNSNSASQTQIPVADIPIPSIETPQPDLQIKVESPSPEPSIMAPAAEPKTPIRVPKASTIYTPSTQDPELRTDINSRLLADGHITT